MEKMIVTEYGRPIMLNKVKEFAQRTMFLAEDKVIPYAVFALLDSGEMVNIGNFNDADTAESSESFWTIFAEDKKAVSMSILKFSESEISLKCHSLLCQLTAICLSNSIKRTETAAEKR